MTIQEAIAAKVLKLMLKNNITQQELSIRMGVDEKIVRQILNADFKIKLSTIITIAKSFNLTLKEFFNDELFKFSNIDL